MDGLVGGWACRAVRGWCFVGKVEEDVLVRLLCSAHGIGISTPCRAVGTRENLIFVSGVSDL